MVKSVLSNLQSLKYGEVSGEAPETLLHYKKNIVDFLLTKDPDPNPGDP